MSRGSPTRSGGQQRQAGAFICVSHSAPQATAEAGVLPHRAVHVSCPGCPKAEKVSTQQEREELRSQPAVLRFSWG